MFRLTPHTPSHRALSAAPCKVQNLVAMTSRRVTWGRLVSVLAVALLSGASASAALADGDPASDYLVSNQVFLTSQSGTASAAQRQLLSVVRAANRAGFPIRVAVISTEYDLGSIRQLWDKPALYARFLGQELEATYRGRLVVVMPNGFGFNWPGHPTEPSYRALAALPVAGGDGAFAAAQNAVRRLAAADRLKLGPTPSAPATTTPRQGGSDTGAILGAVIGGLVVLGAAIALFVRGTRGRPGERRSGAASARVDAPTLRYVIPGAAVLCAAAVAVPIIVAGRGGGTSTAESASVVTPPPFSWPADRRPAPNFVLRDQAERAVSVAGLRGRPVIVTFIDPLCRNLCPLEAQVLNQVERELPASRRPVILAVSVDVYADTRADLLQDVREWHLVPQWRWAVGRSSALAAVWKRYQIGVSVVTKRIAGTTIHYVTHTEGAYVIDASGHERALFLWPFYPQDVKRVLRQLA